jgi:hypothetical protein
VSEAGNARSTATTTSLVPARRPSTGPRSGATLWPSWEAVNDSLVAHLDAIDQRLREYLDDDDRLSLDTVRRLRQGTDVLLNGSITHADLADGWPDWYHLAPAFVAAYAPVSVEDLETNATFLEAPEINDLEPLTEDDRAYLLALGFHLDLYLEMRNVKE